ncbi:MAG: OmpA family protein [Bacteroidetes bacterium]|nr:MAG: OmpA family protein [Bacteroidota bacterium]
MQRIFLFIICLLSISYATAQPKLTQINLVKNGGFETLTDCPDDFGQIDDATGWRGMGGTPDLFTKCTQKGKLHTPANFFGTQIAFEGGNYTGVLAFHEENTNEYIMTQLTEKIERGKKYTIKFRISLAEAYSNYACDGIGIAFLDTLPKEIPSTLKPHVFAHEIMTDSKGWATITQTFMADNNYSYLVLGNFHSREATKRKQVQTSGYPVAYYYVDGVEVLRFIEQDDEENFVKIVGKVTDALTQDPLKARIDFVLADIEYRAYERSDETTGKYQFSHMQKVPQFYLEAKAKGYYSSRVFLQGSDTTHLFTKDFALQPSTVGSSIVLHDLHFETGKAVITKESYPALNMIADFLQSHPNFHIEISGHTDSQGDDALNMTLSENRAKAVLAYFEKQGFINKERMVAKGYGETKPIATNDTPEGMLQNRRVEMMIVKD